MPALSFKAWLGGWVEEGWVPLVEGLYADCIAYDPELIVQQVKEKFGGLRFYFNLSENCSNEAGEAIYALVEAAEAASYKICEQCGEPGAPRGGGWIKTLRDNCAGPDHPPLKD